MPPPLPVAELPLTVQLVSVVVPSLVVQAAAAAVAGGVSADGAVGQRGCAVVKHAAALGGAVFRRSFR